MNSSTTLTNTFTNIFRSTLTYKRLMLFALLLITLLSSSSVGYAQGRKFKNRANLDGTNQKPFREKQDRLTPEERMEKRAARRNLEGAFGGGMQMRLWARVLKLNPEQLARMRQLQRRTGGEYLALEQQIKDKRDNIEELIFTDQVNEDAIKQASTELARLEGQRIMMRTRIQLNIRQLLTPEQLKTYNDVRFGNLKLNLDPEELELNTQDPEESPKK